MTKHNSLNVKLYKKLNSAMKNETRVVLRLSSNMVADDETNFQRKLLLTERQVANLHKSFLINHPLISCYQKPNCPRWYHEKNFLVDFFAHY